MATFNVELRSLCLEVNATYYPREMDSAEGWDIEEVYVVDDEGDSWSIDPDGKFRTEIYAVIEKQAEDRYQEGRIDRWESSRGDEEAA